MTELKQSAFLVALIVHAKSLGGMPNASLTAERLLVAVLDLTAEATDTEEKQNTLALLQMLPLSLTALRARLMRDIDEGKPAPIADILYMQRIMMNEKRRATEQGCEELSADTVIRAILGDRSEHLKRCLEESTVPSEFDQFLTKLKAERDKKASSDEREQEAATELNPRAVITDITERAKKTRQTLLEAVYGQDNAVSVFTAGYFQAELLSLTDKKRVRPRATFLFAGPPGVGKTFLAEKAAEVLGLPFMRFDMSEYADHEANIEFCGSDKVYKNGKAGNVTGFVEENPKCVLLFDEIEKAHLSVIHLFLQMLDAGRLRDNYTDTEVSFTDTILIFTTNAGKQLYEDSESGDFSGVSRKVILRALRKDVNPATHEPYFPAAICSRFASGNVVMFNHIAAHHLRGIAKREVLRHAKNFENEIGIRIRLDERVYTALLFAEGGAADARTVRARAESFFDDELFELFRLLDTSDGKTVSPEEIRFTVELPADNPPLRQLFEEGEPPVVLVFGSEETHALCGVQDSCQLVTAGTPEEAKRLLAEREIALVLIDPFYGVSEGEDYLNAEDIDSLSRRFFRYLKEYHREMPIYLLERESRRLGQEERLSFLRLGVRDVLAMEETFADTLAEICHQLHQQASMTLLSKANKMVTFETAQRLVNDGKTAEIRLFDFAMSVAMDPEDSGAVLSNVSRPDLSFEDVIGAEEAKKELRYFVEYLKNPKKYLGTGVRAPRGVLMYGPPGTGKTLLAKAMAGESDVTFLTAEGNQFLKKYVGEGPELVHDIFRTARKYAPAILFIDEIDAIGKERRGGEHGEGAEETLTAFLTEMDGFRLDPGKPVFVLAATNYEVGSGGPRSLDPALVRRFDRRVYIDLPRKEDRIRYLKMQLGRHRFVSVSEETVENIAVRSTGMSLAELESVIELALRTAIRDGEGRVTDEIFEEAFETFNSGERKQWDPAELERTARHEAGHALLCWHSGETPSYLTVVARADHGGYMQHGDRENKGSYTKDELLARIRTSLGGRAAEMVYYGPREGLTTGASSDLQNATQVAERLLCRYGMDESFGLAVIDTQTIRTGELGEEVRAAVNAILQDELAKAIATIESHRRPMDALVTALLERNHLSGAEIDAILRECDQ